MAFDMFSSVNAKELLQGKSIYFFGDSNMRALYKDILWLLENGTLIPVSRLRAKNEESHANDVRLSNCALHSGRNYEELRAYNKDCNIVFQFITRLFASNFVNYINGLDTAPDVIVLNSCLWDLTRWGSNGVMEFKENLEKTFKFLKDQLPSTRIIWLTTLPPTFKASGGFLTKDIQFTRNTLPWHILFANKYASNMAASFQIDVIDLHYYFRFLLNHHAKDGIHWDSVTVRYAVNILLSNLALIWNKKLPGRFLLDKAFMERSRRIIQSNIESSQIKNNAISKKASKRRNRRRSRKNQSSNISENMPSQPFAFQNERNLENNYLYSNFSNANFNNNQNINHFNNNLFNNIQNLNCFNQIGNSLLPLLNIIESARNYTQPNNQYNSNNNIFNQYNKQFY